MYYAAVSVADEYKIGTGTLVGDPIEMTALGKVFGPHRSLQEPLYV